MKAFQRVTLDPGETRTLRFEVPVGQLGFYDRNLDYVVEDGEIEFLVGTSSSDLVAAGRVVVKTTGPIEKSFDGIRHVD